MRRKGFLSLIFILAFKVAGADYDFVERGRVILPPSGVEFPIYPGRPAKANGYVYVPRGPQGAFVVDARSERAPILMGEIASLRGAVAAQGEILWAADSGTLTAFDVTNPLQLVAIGSRAIPGGIREFMVAGSLIYVVEESAGLRIVDVTNPRTPVLRGRCALPQTGWGKMAVNGNYAIVPDPVSGMTIVNVSNADAPSQVGRYVSPRAFDNDRPGRAVSASGNVAYLADDYFVSAIDISDPNRPALRWEIPSDLNVDVAILDTRVFAVRWEFGVNCYDVSGPVPDWIGTYCPGLLAYSSTALTFHNGVGFLSRGNLSDGGELLLFDAENGANLERAHNYPGSIPVAGASEGAEIYLVELGDNSWKLRVYRSDESGVLQSIGETGAANASDFEVANGIGYLARLETTGVDRYDVSDRAAPRLIETLPISARNLTARGTTLFAVRPSVLETYDLADPLRPRIGGLSISGAFDLVVTDDFAYVAGGSPVVVDVRNVAQLQGVSTPGLEYPSAVAVGNGIGYFGTGNDCGISIYDVSSPTAPRQLSRLRIGDYVTKLWIKGRYFYANGHRGGVHCIDVSDPARPMRVGGISGAKAVVIDGNKIIANGGGGVGVYSVAPELRVQFGTGGVDVFGPAGVAGRLQHSPNLSQWFDDGEVEIGWSAAFSPQPIGQDRNRFWRFRAERTERVAPR